MSEEGAKIETKSVINGVHAGMCWGNFDAKAAECKLCSIAERCSESTKRVTNTASQSVAAPQRGCPEKEKAPEPAPIKASSPPVKSTPPKVEPEPAKPEEKPAKPEKVAREPISVDSFVAEMKQQLGDDIEVQKNDRDVVWVLKLMKAGTCVFQVAILKDGSEVKIASRKGNRVLESGYTKDNLTEAVKALT